MVESLVTGVTELVCELLWLEVEDDVSLVWLDVAELVSDDGVADDVVCDSVVELSKVLLDWLELDLPPEAQDNKKQVVASKVKYLFSFFMASFYRKKEDIKI